MRVNIRFMVFFGLRKVIVKFEMSGASRILGCLSQMDCLHQNLYSREFLKFSHRIKNLEKLS